MNRDADPIRLQPLYIPTRALSRIAAATLVVAAAVSWTAAGYELGEVRTLTQIREDGALPPAEHLAHARAGDLLQTLQLGSAALVAVAFFPWLYQVRCNLRAFGVRRLRFGREWTYLAFLVPPLNLFRPLQVMSEVWRGSDPGTSDPVAWQRQPTPPLVAGWWVTLLAWIAIELISTLLLQLATGPTRVQLGHALALGGDVSAALSASLGSLLVGRLRRAQDAKWQAFGHGEPGERVLAGPLPA